MSNEHEPNDVFSLYNMENGEFNQVFGPFVRCTECNCRNYFDAIRFGFAFGLFDSNWKEIKQRNCIQCSNAHRRVHTQLSQLHKTQMLDNRQNEQQTKRTGIEKERLEMNTRRNKKNRKTNSKTRKQLKWIKRCSLWVNGVLVLNVAYIVHTALRRWCLCAHSRNTM